MQYVIGCSMPQQQFAQFCRLLVSDPAPYFATDQARSQLPRDLLWLSRADYATAARMEERDSFQIYAVQPEATHVALIGAAEVRSMPRTQRQHLHRLQWQLGRSHVYDRSVIAPLLAADEHRWVDQITVATDDSDKVVLDYDVWRSLSDESRWRWLQYYVSLDRAVCRSRIMDDQDWQRIEQQHGPIIRELAGSFAWHSGPNCFATTLAAATRNVERARSIAAMWLHGAPFLRELAARGYRHNPLVSVEADLPSGAVVVWVDQRGTPQHSCFVVERGLALNKDAQAWYAPRQILPLHTVREQWQDDHLMAHVYLR